MLAPDCTRCDLIWRVVRLLLDFGIEEIGNALTFGGQQSVQLIEENG